MIAIGLGFVIVSHAASHTATAAGRDGTGDKRSATSKDRVVVVPPKAVWASCPEAMADGTIVDGHQLAEVGTLAVTLKWDGGYGAPGACHRTVRLFCGPDIDRDGDPEAIAQIGWWSATDGDSCESLREAADHWLITYTFLVSRHAAVWRAVAPLGVDVDADGSGARRSATFIRRTHGDMALRTEWSTVSSDTGCRIGGYEVFALHAGALRKLEAGDNSLPCIQCDCDRR